MCLPVCLSVCPLCLRVVMCGCPVCSQALSRRWAAWLLSLTSWMPSTYQMASPTNLSWLRWSLRFHHAEEAPLEAPGSQSPAPVSGAVKGEICSVQMTQCRATPRSQTIGWDLSTQLTRHSRFCWVSLLSLGLMWRHLLTFRRKWFPNLNNISVFWYNSFYWVYFTLNKQY